MLKYIVIGSWSNLHTFNNALHTFRMSQRLYNILYYIWYDVTTTILIMILYDFISCVNYSHQHSVICYLLAVMAKYSPAWSPDLIPCLNVAVYFLHIYQCTKLLQFITNFIYLCNINNNIKFKYYDKIIILQIIILYYLIIHTQFHNIFINK